MRIHSDSIDELEIRKAARLAGVSFTRFGLQGSRSRAASFDVILTGSSPRRQNQGEDMAATWDEWGIFLSHLFGLDPAMHTGRGSYESAEHFQWSTGARYTADLTPLTQHVSHTWGYSGGSVGGSYHVSECKCGAIRRWLSRGTFAEFVAATA